jgi:hypothetical protein
MIEALPSRYPRWQRVRLVVVHPSGTPEPHSINEVVTSLFHGLQALGCSVDIRENEPIEDGTNIYFRAHLLPLPSVSEMPPGSIVYNFEQIFDQSPWVGPVYRDLLSRVTVWDYSRRNLGAIAEFADPRRLHLVPVGYMPQLTRIAPAHVEDIDVLFYGVVNARRRAILAALREAGLRVHVETRIAGAARDGLIARAKLVLNLHFYPTAIFEIVRVSYLLSNRKAVIGEVGPDTEIDDDIREAIAAASYDRLCETVHDLIGEDERRKELALRGQEIFARRHLPTILSRAIAESAAVTQPMAPAERQLQKTANGAPANSRPAAGECAADGTRPRRVLFHAINGAGLGHVVRLSIIAKALNGGAEIAFFSTCRFADHFWPGRLFGVDERIDGRFELAPEQRNLLGFHLALNKFKPDVVVCDTHWPKAVLRSLREAGVRTVLVLRSLSIAKMEPALRVACRDFSSVLLPHHPAELEATYASESGLLGQMLAAPCICIGPVARTAATGNAARRVIFTLGGGGEYWNLTQAVTVDSFMREFRSAAAILRETFGIEPIFAAGPLLDSTDDGLAPFSVIRSQDLHEMFGPGTVVVTRGGYNTCWETIAAGGGLVIVGEHLAHGVEDVGARGRFLAAEGLARHVATDATAIVEACMALMARPAATHDHYLRRSVNGGLDIAREAILGLPGVQIHSLVADMADE